MKNSKLCIAAVIAGCLLASVLFAGCSDSNKGSQTQPAQKNQQETTQQNSSGLKTAMFEQPMLITSVGQSADAQMVKALAERNGLKYEYDVAAKSDRLANVKTLVMVIGGSSKGLGAAGVNQAQESQRAKNLIAAAKEKGIQIIAMHVGGAGRRGELTDNYIPLLADANYAIIVADGDKDGAFTKIFSGKIPVDKPANINEVGKYLKAAFK